MQYSGEDNLDVLRLAKNYNRFLIDKVCALIHKPDMQIVDFGAGEGYLAEEVAKNSGCHVICLEPADNLQKFYVGKMHYQSLTEITDETLDYIYSLNVLEHIEDDAAIVEAFYQKLKHGGKIFLYLPAFNVLYSSMDEKVGHFRRYDKSTLKKLFADENKWRIKKLYYADFAGYFVTLLYKIIGSEQGDINPNSLKIYDRFIFPISRFLDKITVGKILGKNVCIVVEKK